MFEAKIVNTNLNSIFNELILTPDTFNDEYYQLISITGLEPGKSQMNLTNVAGSDGALLNSVFLPTRNIVLTIKINKSDTAALSSGVDVRGYIMQILNVKDNVQFYFKNEFKNVVIDGTIESCEYNLFEKSVIMQVSIICPDPNFRIIENTESKCVEVPLLKNPTEPGRYYNTRVTTDTSFDIGCRLKFDFHSTVTYFSFQRFTNSDSYNIFSDETNPILSGDTVIANLYKNDYYIKLIHNNNETSLINQMEKIDFFQLKPKVSSNPDTPGNYIGYVCKNGNDYVSNLVDVTLYYQNEVRGI